MHSLSITQRLPQAANFLRKHAQGCKGSGSAEFNLDNLVLGPRKSKDEYLIGS